MIFSTEEDNALLHCRHGTGLLESEAEAEFVVDSAERGEKEASESCDKDGSGEADESRATIPNLRGFGKRDSSDGVGDEDVESLVKTGRSILPPAMTVVTLTTQNRRKLSFS